MRELEKKRLYRLELERQTKIKEENRKKEKEEEAALKKEQVQQYEVRELLKAGNTRHFRKCNNFSTPTSCFDIY